jgi:hypothetical protein
MISRKTPINAEGNIDVKKLKMAELKAELLKLRLDVR